jgi:hypothetical protein
MSQPDFTAGSKWIGTFAEFDDREGLPFPYAKPQAGEFSLASASVPLDVCWLSARPRFMAANRRSRVQGVPKATQGVNEARRAADWRQKSPPQPHGVKWVDIEDRWR